MEGAFLVALHQPELAECWQRLGEFLRYKASLPLRLVEIAVLVTARRWRCQLQWHLHSMVAENAGLPTSIIDDICAGRRPATWEQDDLIVYDFTRNSNFNVGRRFWISRGGTR